MAHFISFLEMGGNCPWVREKVMRARDRQRVAGVGKGRPHKARLQAIVAWEGPTLLLLVQMKSVQKSWHFWSPHLFRQLEQAPILHQGVLGILLIYQYFGGAKSPCRTRDKWFPACKTYEKPIEPLLRPLPGGVCPRPADLVGPGAEQNVAMSLVGRASMARGSYWPSRQPRRLAKYVLPKEVEAYGLRKVRRDERRGEGQSTLVCIIIRITRVRPVHRQEHRLALGLGSIA